MRPRNEGAFDFHRPVVVVVIGQAAADQVATHIESARRHHVLAAHIAENNEHLFRVAIGAVDDQVAINDQVYVTQHIVVDPQVAMMNDELTLIQGDEGLPTAIRVAVAPNLVDDALAFCRGEVGEYRLQFGEVGRHGR